MSVFVSDSCLSKTLLHHRHPLPPSQPLLYLGGCYREGRWLITINRTERVCIRGLCTPTTRTTMPKNQKKWEFVARREEGQLYDLPPPPLTPLPVVGAEPWICWFGGQMVNEPHRPTAGRRLHYRRETWQDRVTPRPVQPMREWWSRGLRIDPHLLPTGNVWLHNR